MKTVKKYKYALAAFICVIGLVIIKLWMTEFHFIAKVFGTIGMLVLAFAALLKIDSLDDSDNMIV